jgi:pimeloyl-ACP methyl ester carboxylesterase
VRQPEVGRLAALGLAALLALPVVPALRGLLISAAFLVEFLTGGAHAPLTRMTAPPRLDTVTLPTGVADRWRPLQGPGRTLVLVHGLTEDGKEDPRLRRAAALLARAGFAVIVPTIPGLTRGRLRVEDVAPVTAALAASPGPAVVVGVSVGAGPAMLGAADPSVRDRVDAIVSLGGYASAPELVRYYLTGEYGWKDRSGRVHHDPALVRAFVEANADLLAPATRRVLAAGDLQAVARVVAAPPPELAALLARLSPLQVAGEIPGTLILIHGRDDPAVPYTESLRLAEARGGDTRLVVVDVLRHVEGATLRARLAAGRDLLALLTITYRLLAS